MFRFTFLPELAGYSIDRIVVFSVPPDAYRIERGLDQQLPGFLLTDPEVVRLISLGAIVVTFNDNQPNTPTSYPLPYFPNKLSQLELDTAFDAEAIGLTLSGLVASNVEAGLGLLDTSVDTLTTQMSTVLPQVATLSTDVATLNTSVGSLNTSVGSLSTQVASLNTQVISLNTGFGTLASTATFTNGDILLLDSAGTSISVNPFTASSPNAGKFTLKAGNAASLAETAGGELVLSAGGATGSEGSFIRGLVAPATSGATGTTAVAPIEVVTINHDANTTYVELERNAFIYTLDGTLEVKSGLNFSAFFSGDGTGETRVGGSGTGAVIIGNGTTRTTRIVGNLKIDTSGVLEATIATAQTVTANTTTTVRFDNTGFTRGLVSQVTGTGIITLPRAGTYLVKAHCSINANFSAGQLYKLLFTGTNFTPTDRIFGIYVPDSNGTRTIELGGTIILRTSINNATGSVQLQAGSPAVNISSTANTNQLVIYELG